MLNDFLEKSPTDMGPQHAAGFKDSVIKAYKNTEDLSLVVSDNKGVKAYLPFFRVKSKILGNIVISVPFFDVGGLCGDLDANCIKKLGDLLDKLGHQGDSIQIKMDKSSSNFGKFRSFLLKKGFSESTNYQQFIVKISSEDEMWKKFHKHTRNDVRMARKSGLNLVKINNDLELKTFYNLYVREMHRFGTPQHSFVFFKELMKCNGLILSGFNCYHSGKVVASIIIIHSGKKSSVLVNVSNPLFRSKRPNDLLYWESIKYLISAGVETMDTGQVNLIHEKGSREWSLYKFKKKWLAEPFDCSIFEFSSEKSSANTRKTKDLRKFRKIWSLLPSVFVRFLGPRLRSQLAL